MDTICCTPGSQEIADEPIDPAKIGEVETPPTPAAASTYLAHGFSSAESALAGLQLLDSRSTPEEVLSALWSCFESLVDADDITYQHRIQQVLGRLAFADIKLAKGKVKKLATDIRKASQLRKDAERAKAASEAERTRLGSIESWKRELTYRNGECARTSSNLVTILRYAPDWEAVLGYDERTQRVVYLNAPPWRRAEADRWTVIPLDEVDPGRFCMWFEKSEFALLLTPKSDALWNAIELVARDRSFDRVRDYLNGLQWDGKLRLGMMAFTHLGASAANGGDDAGRDLYTAAVVRKWMIGAVARGLQPGSKMDNMLILQGAQGIGKSRALRILSGEQYFTDHIADVQNKDAAMALHSKWIIEMAELEHMGRAESNALKRFMTTQADQYRAPYKRTLEEHPRRSVFCGTTNNSEYFKDSTGNRRYWPIEIEKPDHEALERDRGQLWAEAVHAYRAGEAWYLQETEIIAQANREQAKRMVTDAWEKTIADYVAANVFSEGGFERVTSDAVLRDGIKKPIDQWTQADKMRVAAVLQSLGFTRKLIRVNGKREWVYARYPQDSELGVKGEEAAQ